MNARIIIGIYTILYFIDSDIEVVERPGETADSPESETKELLKEKKSEENEVQSDEIQS